MKVVPGDPFGEEQTLPTATHQLMRKHYGLDQPLYIQYKNYLLSILKWDLGPSFAYPDRTINSIIKDSFPVSALLGLEALLIALSLGIALGCCAALKEHKWEDHLIILGLTLAISTPSFILATLLQYVFALKLGWLPLARWGSFSHTILPALALASFPAAFIARLVRSNMLEVLKSDYIKMAKAKGLSTSTIILKHALRNALLPVLTYSAPLLANILVGSFIIEKIFSIPGLGQWFVNSVSNRDYTIIMGVTVFYSALLMSTVLLIDIAYHYLDPRIKELE
jgi:oligopeptide transport system permease protein